MNKLLARQLRRAFATPNGVPAGLDGFIRMVDDTYRQADDDRARLEQSMETVSHELMDRNSRMRAALTESERSQEELTDALALLEATLESTDDGILVVGIDGRILKLNRRFVEMWGIPDAVLAQHDDAAMLDYAVDQLDDPTQFMSKVEEIYGHPDTESFDTLRFSDDRVFERYSKPQRVNGATVGRVWRFRDVTGRMQLESQLRQSQKMEAIGSLAGGVAHDFNNLLTVIGGHVEFLQEDGGLSESQRQDLAEIRTAAQRATTLTRQLLAFSRKQILHNATIDVSAVVQDLQPMLRRLIGEDIEIDLALGPETLITGDRGQLEQVVLNLALNARDAMPGGGCVAIQTAACELEQGRRINHAVTLPAGAYVILSVRDTGSGMSPGIMNRIFEPFYTTKEAGKGTGLGLSTVYGIIKQSEGYIEVESDVGVGTAFTIFIPAAAGRASAAVIQVPDAECAPGFETILLVEDEEVLRRFVQRVLEKHGYTVLMASTGQEALEIAYGYEGGIDLVLADVVMPGMGGPELAEQLQRTPVGAPVLFMSGYTDDEMIRRGVVQSEMFLLEKPFTGPQLCSAVFKALAQEKLLQRQTE